MEKLLRMTVDGEAQRMSTVQVSAQAMVSTLGISNLRSALSSDDAVALGLRESARRMIGIAVFSGVVNVLMLSGSLYMLQVYDRVIPSRNIATLLGLSLMVLLAYFVQGYFDALRARMLCRVATLFDAGLQQSIHTALATLPLRGVKPMLMQQPLRDLDQVRSFMSGMGPTAFLDMPWIPIFLVALFLFHPAIGMTALIGTAAIIAMTLLTERMSRGAAKAAMDSSAQRQVLADATQRNAEVIRALGMTSRFAARWLWANERFLRQNVRATDVYANLGSGAKVLRYVLQSGLLGIGAYLVVADRASGGVMIASSIMMGRALAPIETALGSWKQLVAARQGIARLQEICKATAAPRRRPWCCRARVGNFRRRISAFPRPERIRQSSRMFPSRSRPAWVWRCWAPAPRARHPSPRRW
jgi:ATP-binding cassette, subfamily C, bacterial PrsD